MISPSSHPSSHSHAAAVPDLVTMTEARLTHAVPALRMRFDADVAAMTRHRGASGSFRSAALLVEITIFGERMLERYRDRGLALVHDGFAPGPTLAAPDAVRLRAAVATHLRLLHDCSAERLRELAIVIDCAHVAHKLQGQLSDCALRCEAELDRAIGSRTQRADARRATGLVGNLRRAWKALAAAFSSTAVPRKTHAETS